MTCLPARSSFTTTSRACETRGPVRAGRTINVVLRLYWPKTSDSGRTVPAIVYYHGGGHVIGSLDTHDFVARNLCAGAEALVASVDYRMGPEHKFPAAVEDCVAATEWVADNAASLGVDAKRLAVGGDSAGGNLAAVVSLMARDRGAPRISYQLLIYPALDAAMTQPSIARYAEGYLLTRATMRWFYEQYLRTPEDAADWRVSPLAAPDLGGVAPAFVLTAGYDPLCDEGDAYAARLAAAGVAVIHRRFADQIHGFAMNGKLIRAADAALDEAAAALRQAWV